MFDGLQCSTFNYPNTLVFQITTFMMVVKDTIQQFILLADIAFHYLLVINGRCCNVVTCSCIFFVFLLSLAYFDSSHNKNFEKPYYMDFWFSSSSLSASFSSFSCLRTLDFLQCNDPVARYCLIGLHARFFHPHCFVLGVGASRQSQCAYLL